MELIELSDRIELPALTEHKHFRGAPDILRTSQQAGSAPTDLLANGHLIEISFGHTLKHSIVENIHNLFWGAVINGGYMYDVWFHDIGWYSANVTDDRAPWDGHGFDGEYSQNERFYPQGSTTPAEPKVAENCVYVAAFEGGKLWALGTDRLHHFARRRCIYFGKFFLVGSTTFPGDDITLDDCAFLCDLLLGYVAANNGTITVTNCLLSSLGGQYQSPGVLIGGVNQDKREPYCEHLTFTGNTVVCGKSDLGANRRCVQVTGIIPAGWDIDNNVYYCSDPFPFIHNWQDADGTPHSAAMNFEQWQALGFDAHSTFYPYDPPSPIIRIYTVPEVNAANIAVVNPTGLQVIALPFDVSYYTNITAFEARDTETTYDGRGGLRMVGNVAAPMNWTGSPTAAPLWSASLPRHGVFRLGDIVIDPILFQQTVDQLAVLQAQAIVANDQIATLTTANEALTLENATKQTLINSQTTEIGSLNAQITALLETEGNDPEQLALIASLTDQVATFATKKTALQAAFAAQETAKANVNLALDNLFEEG